MFHINTETGDPVACRSSKCSKPAHYATKEEARAVFERMLSDAHKSFKPPIKKTGPRTPRETAGAQALRLRRAQVIAEQDRVLERKFENLNEMFERFWSSPEASAPPVERGDWRAKQASDAERNGDARHDANPDMTVSGYHDASVQEGDDDYVNPNDLPEEFRPF